MNDLAELPDCGCAECLRIFLPDIYEPRLEEIRTGKPNTQHGSFLERRIESEELNHVKYEVVKPVNERPVPVGTRKPFAGEFRCQNCNYQAVYSFFDSEPTKTRCNGCFEYDTAILIRVLERTNPVKTRQAKKKEMVLV